MKKQSLVRTLNTVFAVTLPLVALVACGGQDHQGASFDPNAASIVKGQTVKAADPLGKMVVALVMDLDQGQALCTGSIIADDTILTAAHCVDNNPKTLTIVFATDVKRSSADDRRQASAFAQNPAWDSSPNSLGDLALIHFDSGLPSGYTATTLATSGLKLTSGEPVTVIGYGVTNGTSHAGAGVLRETQTTVKQQFSPTQVVTDGETSSVCFGDSGGPAFTTDGSQALQWGVASAVTSEDCKTAAVHTSVMSYHAWITKTAAALRKASASGNPDNDGVGGNDGAGHGDMDGGDDGRGAKPKKSRKRRGQSPQSPDNGDGDDGFLP